MMVLITTACYLSQDISVSKKLQHQEEPLVSTKPSAHIQELITAALNTQATPASPKIQGYDHHIYRQHAVDDFNHQNLTGYPSPYAQVPQSFRVTLHCSNFKSIQVATPAAAKTYLGSLPGVAEAIIPNGSLKDLQSAVLIFTTQDAADSAFYHLDNKFTTADSKYYLILRRAYPELVPTLLKEVHTVWLPTPAMAEEGLGKYARGRQLQKLLASGDLDLEVVKTLEFQDLNVPKPSCDHTGLVLPDFDRVEELLSKGMVQNREDATVYKVIGATDLPDDVCRMLAGTSEPDLYSIAITGVPMTVTTEQLGDTLKKLQQDADCTITSITLVSVKKSCSRVYRLVVKTAHELIRVLQQNKKIRLGPTFALLSTTGSSIVGQSDPADPKLAEHVAAAMQEKDPNYETYMKVTPSPFTVSSPQQAGTSGLAAQASLPPCPAWSPAPSLGTHMKQQQSALLHCCSHGAAPWEQHAALSSSDAQWCVQCRDMPTSQAGRRPTLTDPLTCCCCSYCCSYCCLCCCPCCSPCDCPPRSWPQEQLAAQSGAPTGPGQQAGGTMPTASGLTSTSGSTSSSRRAPQGCSCDGQDKKKAPSLGKLHLQLKQWQGPTGGSSVGQCTLMCITTGNAPAMIFRHLPAKFCLLAAVLVAGLFGTIGLCILGWTGVHRLALWLRKAFVNTWWLECMPIGSTSPQQSLSATAVNGRRKPSLYQDYPEKLLTLHISYKRTELCKAWPDQSKHHVKIAAARKHKRMHQRLKSRLQKLKYSLSKHPGQLYRQQPSGAPTQAPAPAVAVSLKVTENTEHPIEISLTYKGRQRRTKPNPPGRGDDSPNTYRQLEQLALLQAPATAASNDTPYKASAWVYCHTSLLQIPRIESRLIPLWVNTHFSLSQDPTHNLYAALPLCPSMHSTKEHWEWVPAAFFLSHFGFQAGPASRHPCKTYPTRLPKSARKYLNLPGPNPAPRPTQPNITNLAAYAYAASKMPSPQPQQASRQQPLTPGSPTYPSTLSDRQGGPGNPQRQATRQQRQDRMLANAVPGLNAGSSAAAAGSNPASRTTQHPNALFDNPDIHANPLYENMDTDSDEPELLVPSTRNQYNHIHYFRQEQSNCWLHAHNALMQAENISPANVIRSLDAERLGRAFLNYQAGGPFHSMEINRYLYKHATPAVYYKCVVSYSGTRRGLTQQELTDALPPETKGVLIAFTHRHGYQHMKCIRYINSDRQWYAIESIGPTHVEPLRTDASWRYHTKNSQVFVLLKANTFTWDQMALPAPLQLPPLERDQQRQAFDIDQHLRISSNPTRNVEEMYTEEEIRTDSRLQTPCPPQPRPAPAEARRGRPPAPRAPASTTAPENSAPAQHRPPEPPRPARQPKPAAHKPAAPKMKRTAAPKGKPPPQRANERDIRTYFQGAKRPREEPQVQQVPPASEEPPADLITKTPAMPSTPQTNTQSETLPASPAPNATQQQSHAAAAPKLKLMVLNVQGLQTGQADVLHTLTTHKPDVMVLTETKLTRKARSRMCSLLAGHGYRQRHSNLPDCPAAGVTILIHQTFDELGLIENLPMPDDLAGYLKAIQIRLPGSTPLDLLGVYMPMCHPADKLIRERIYKQIKSLTDDANDKQAGTRNLLVAGDFNASLTDSDRASNRRHTMDAMHRQHMQEAALLPLDAPQPGQRRQFTWRQGSAEEPTSRIDDVLTNNPSLPAHTQTKVWDMTGTCTDHNLLEMQIPFQQLSMMPPPPPLPEHGDAPTEPERLRRLKKLTKAERAALKITVEALHGATFHTLNDKLQTLLTTDIQKYWDQLQHSDPTARPPPIHINGATDPQAIATLMESLNKELTDALVAARDTLLEEGPTQQPNPTGRHYRPRQVALKRTRLAWLQKQIVYALRMEPTDLQQLSPQIQQALDQLIEDQPTREDVPLQDSLKALKRHTRKQIQAIDKKHKTKKQQARRVKLQALYDKKQKIGNQIITGQYKGRNNMQLRAIETAEGVVVTEPTAVQDTIEKYYTPKLIPPMGPDTKTGRYLPEEQQRNYPWLAPDAPDRFTLATAPSTNAAPRRWLHDLLADKQAFTACLKSLAHGKAPGPDGITNEMLNILPEQAQDMLHAYIQLMWATGYTPASWKQSLTILLFKNKGTPLHLKYYRRIGLENTVYKLWTRMITWAMADYAERYNLLSYTQGGFRNKRTTADQLELFTMLLEDAKLTKQDLYLLMVDFSEAFDTIDHDKMLQIMYDLGFPTDAIEVVKQLYTGATTTISTPFGPLQPINMDRGTIQGDSLSPFLFVLYLEPLLRWLRVGARGYMPGCLAQGPSSTLLKNQIPDVTYADDLNLLSSSPEDLATQADKVTRYADWGHLLINSTKTLLTGARYKTSPKDPYNTQCLQRLLAAVKVQKAKATFHNPTKPFRYLGVQFTLHLNWKAQFDKSRDTLKQMVWHMSHSHATTAQKIRTLNSCLRSKIRYAFCVAPYNKSRLKALDAVLCKAAKEAYGLPKCLATAAAHEDTAKGGLGCPSLLVEYTTIQIQRLTAALNDAGPLGELTRARMSQDKACLDTVTAAAHPTLACHSMRLRQQLAGISINIQMVKEGTIPHRLLERNQLLQEMQALLADQNRLAQLAQALPEPPELLMLDLHHLHRAGIRTLADLAPTDRTLLAPKKVAERLGLKKGLPARAATALRRVSYMLTQPPGQPAYTSRPPRLTSQARIDPEYARVLQRGNHIPTMDIRQATIPQLLTAYEDAPRTEAALDEVQQYLSSLTQKEPCRRTRATSSIREIIQTQAEPLTSASETGYAVYRRLATKKGPAAFNQLQQLYHNYAHNIDEIAGFEATAQASKSERDPENHKRRRVTKRQTQVVVRWHPSLLQGWQIQIAKRMAYNVAQEPPPQQATREQIQAHPHLATECCGPNFHMAEGDSEDEEEPAQRNLLHCAVCHRRYHTECVPLLHRLNAAPIWTCQECATNNYTTVSLPADLRYYQVHWLPSCEPLDTYKEDPALAPLIADFLAQKEAAEKEQNATTRAPSAMPLAENCSKLTKEQRTLTQMQQQGDYYPDHPQRYDIKLGQGHSSKLWMDTSPTNPHADIHPTGQHEVFIRAVDMRIDGADCTHTLACIYTPDGKCRFTLTPARAAILHRQYTHSRQYKPRLMRRLKAGSFAEELYALMCRYKEGAAIGGTNSRRIVKLKNHWATPHEIYAALQALTGASKERFASPLNYNPGMKQYWSIHKRDQLFGASWDAYKYKWTGCSVHNPEYEDAEMNKDVATAIAAARSTEDPVLGIHILPAWSNTSQTAYLAWLQRFPENCYHALQIPKKHFRFQTPDAEERGQTYAGTPKWDVNIIITGNAQGFQQHFPYREGDGMRRFEAAFRAALNSTLPASKQVPAILTLRPQHTAQPSPAGHAPTSYSPLLRQLGYPKPESYGKRKLDTPTQADCTGVTDPSSPLDRQIEALQEQLMTETGPAPPLRYDWRDLAYTDGSCRQKGRSRPGDWPRDCHGIGAAVYIPAGRDLEEPADDVVKQCVPTERKMYKTINRAELVAILMALQAGAIRIATDSLCSMHQIMKQLRRPQDQNEHQHCSLLKQIAELIQSSTQQIRLFKVKGHSHAIGNEHADELAKEAAKTPTCERDQVFTDPSNDRHSKYWPHEVKPENGLNPKGQARRPIPLVDLKEAIKEVSHPACKLGMANRNTFYFESLKAIEELTDQDASNAFMHSSKVSFAERKIALAYRYGVMWSRKLAKRYGLATSSECTLCGQEDGGHHTASGCKALERQYTERHNKIGRIIMRQVLRGRYGTWAVQLDLGSSQKCDEDGLPHLPRTIPWSTLPNEVAQQVQAAVGTLKQRPDGLIYKPKQDKEPAEYWIIEVKICRDSDDTSQRNNASQQHEALQRAIKEADPEAKVYFMPLLIGVSGTIYTSTRANLEAMGVKDSALKSCLADIHFAAIKSLHSIYTAKRNMEQSHEPRMKGHSRGPRKRNR